MLLQTPANPPFCWRRKKCDSLIWNLRVPSQELKFYFTATLQEHDRPTRPSTMLLQGKPAFADLWVFVETAPWVAMLSTLPLSSLIIQIYPASFRKHASHFFLPPVHLVSTECQAVSFSMPLSTLWGGHADKVSIGGKWPRVGALASQKCLSGRANLLAKMERDVSDEKRIAPHSEHPLHFSWSFLRSNVLLCMTGFMWFLLKNIYFITPASLRAPEGHYLWVLWGFFFQLWLFYKIGTKVGHEPRYENVG